MGGRQILKQPPSPLNTIEMQKRSSRYRTHIGIGAEEALKLAEELYQVHFFHNTAAGGFLVTIFIYDGYVDIILYIFF